LYPESVKEIIITYDAQREIISQCQRACTKIVLPLYKFSVKIKMLEGNHAERWGTKVMDQNDIISAEELEHVVDADLPKLLPVPLKYEKSNMLIYGRYNMSKMAQKTLAYALSTLRGRHFTKRDMEMGISVTFSSSEIKHVLVNPNAARRGTLSKELKNIALNLHGKTVFIMGDDDNDDFVSFTFIKTCEYSNDLFTITFHENMSPYLVNLEKSGNFTVLDVNHIKGMRSSYTIRIYEICESFAFLAKKHNGIFVKKFNLIEFKLMIGIIDSEDPDIRAITSRYKTDYYTIGKKIEELYDSALKEIDDINEKLNHASELSLSEKDKADYIKALLNGRKSQSEKITQIHKYRSATEFRRRVLEVAKKELGEMMDRGEVDVCFDFEMVTVNQHIQGFQMVILTREGREIYRKQKKESNRQFTLYDYPNFKDVEKKKKKGTARKDTVPDEQKEGEGGKKEELLDTLDRIDSYLQSHPHKVQLSFKDIYILASLVDSDVFIEKFAQMQGASEIRNPMGWMMAAIKGDYKKPANNSRKNAFDQFSQNEYDFTALEQELLANQEK